MTSGLESDSAGDIWLLFHLLAGEKTAFLSIFTQSRIEGTKYLTLGMGSNGAVLS